MDRDGREAPRGGAIRVARGGGAAARGRWCVLLLAVLVAAALAGCLGATDDAAAGTDEATTRGGDAALADDADEATASGAGDEGDDGDGNASDDRSRWWTGESTLTAIDYRARRYVDRPEAALEGAVVAGVYVSDVDRDGRRDLLAIGGDRPTVFRNTGEGFDERRRFDLEGTVRSALFLDHDGDGWDDLLLLRSGGNASVFYENVEGRFERRAVGLERVFEAPRGAVAGDVDGDGCLDVAVYQANYWSRARPAGYGDWTVEEDNGGRNLLFEGDCETFALRRDALPAETRWSLAASMIDVDGDGRPDLHVANDFNRDVLYVNEGDWSFRAREIAETNRNGMSSEVGDVDGDGRPDVFVSNIHVPNDSATGVTFNRLGKRISGNNLLVNDGDGGFVDRAERYGVRRGGWGWAAVLADFDLDGDDDLVQATSAAPGVDGANRYWRRAGDGFAAATPPGLTAPLNSFGVAAYDHDGDGALDLALTSVEGFQGDGTPYLRYDNPAEGDWIGFDVRRGGSHALGASVTVATTDGSTTRWVTSGSDYLSQDSRRIHVGLGDADPRAVTVSWPDGTSDRYGDLEPNRYYRVTGDGIQEAGEQR